MSDDLKCLLKIVFNSGKMYITKFTISTISKGHKVHSHYCADINVVHL